jgi:hypothetical protein
MSHGHGTVNESTRSGVWSGRKSLIFTPSLGKHLWGRGEGVGPEIVDFECPGAPSQPPPLVLARTVPRPWGTHVPWLHHSPCRNPWEGWCEGSGRKSFIFGAGGPPAPCGFCADNAEAIGNPFSMVSAQYVKKPVGGLGESVYGPPTGSWCSPCNHQFWKSLIFRCQGLLGASQPHTVVFTNWSNIVGNRFAQSQHSPCKNPACGGEAGDRTRNS